MILQFFRQYIRAKVQALFGVRWHDAAFLRAARRPVFARVRSRNAAAGNDRKINLSAEKCLFTIRNFSGNIYAQKFRRYLECGGTTPLFFGRHDARFLRGSVPVTPLPETPEASFLHQSASLKIYTNSFICIYDLTNTRDMV